MSTLASLIRAGIPEWQERANCNGVPTDAFYPEKGESPRGALRICAGCEVRTECLEWALDAGERVHAGRLAVEARGGGARIRFLVRHQVHRVRAERRHARRRDRPRSPAVDLDHHRSSLVHHTTSAAAA